MSWVLGLTLIVTSTGRSADDTGTVRHYGDPKAIRMEGCRLVPAEQVREALAWDWQVQLASTPSASLVEYLNTIERVLRVGYKRNGFPEAQVAADLDWASGAIVVKVEEGKRYMAGEVRVKGAKQVDVQRLRQALVEPQLRGLFGVTLDAEGGVLSIGGFRAEAGKPKRAWYTGEEARFDAASLKEMERAAREALLAQGFFRPKMRLDVRGEPDGTAALSIEFEDEGPRAVLERVECIGLKKNAPEQVLKLVGLEPGMPLDLAKLQRAQQKLWDCARFWEHRIQAQSIDGEAGKVLVKLHLLEYEPAPRLDEELSELAQMLLLCRDWVAGLKDREEDLEIRLTVPGGSRFRTIVDWDRGLYFEAEAATAGPGAPPTPYCLMVARDHCGVYLPAQGKKLAGGGAPGHLAWNFQYIMKVNSETGKPEPRILMGASVEGAGKDKPPVQVHLVLSPVALLSSAHGAAAHGGAVNIEVKDQVLTIREGPDFIRVDAVTGRIMELVHGETRLEVALVPEGFAMARSALETRSKDWANVYDPKRPVGSVSSFAMEQWLRLIPVLNGQPDEKWDRAAAAAAKLLSPELFDEIDRLATREERGERFRMSSDPAAFGPNPGSGVIAVAMLPFVDEFFERGSWPWTVARETIVAVAGLSLHARTELARVHDSKSTGPIGYLAAAEMLRLVNPELGGVMAKRGLAELNEEKFLADCRTLLQGDSAQSRMALRLVGHLRDQEEADIDALAAVLPQVAGVKPLWSALQAERGKGLEQTLEAVERRWWGMAIEVELRRRLEELGEGK